MLGIAALDSAQGIVIKQHGSKPKVVIKKKSVQAPAAKAPVQEVSEDGIAAKAIASNGLDVPDNLIQK